ncbi:hypothetical protein ACOME3_009071 [Neoechinorhynchus agilis]
MLSGRSCLSFLLVVAAIISYQITLETKQRTQDVSEFWWLDHPFYINADGHSYCESHSDCCGSNRDDLFCSVLLSDYGTSCYCDSFCLRSKRDMDCCPDYFYICKSNLSMSAMKPKVSFSSEQEGGDEITLESEEFCMDLNGDRVEHGAYVYQFCNRYKCLLSADTDNGSPPSGSHKLVHNSEKMKLGLSQIDYHICANDNRAQRVIRNAEDKRQIFWTGQIYGRFAPLDIDGALQLYTTGLQNISESFQSLPIIKSASTEHELNINLSRYISDKAEVAIFDQGRCGIASTIASVLFTIADALSAKGIQLSGSLSVQHVLSCVIAHATCTNARISAVTVWLSLMSPSGHLNIPLLSQCYPYRNGETDQNSTIDDCVETRYELESYETLNNMYSNHINSCNRLTPMIPSTLRFGRILSGDIASIKRHILKCGSVQATVKVSPSFFSYSKGIYSTISDADIDQNTHYAYHSIRIIGWHNENESAVPSHWIAVNSWGYDWGEEGFIRIMQGALEIERFVVGVMC